MGGCLVRCHGHASWGGSRPGRHLDASRPRLLPRHRPPRHGDRPAKSNKGSEPRRSRASATYFARGQRADGQSPSSVMPRRYQDAAGSLPSGSPVDNNKLYLTAKVAHTLMDETGRLRWGWTVILVGVTYLAVGIIFGTLAGWAASNQIRVAWRLAAWVISAVVFAAHIGFEHVRLHSSPSTTALHASLAVALGAVALAVAAILHSHAPSSHPRYLAFLVWPVVIALPAFVVALGSATVLARARRST